MSIVQPINRDELFLQDDDDWDSVHHVEWEIDANFFVGDNTKSRTPLCKATSDHQIIIARAAALIIRTSLNNIPIDIPDFDPAALTGSRKKLHQWMSAYNTSQARKLVLGDVKMTVMIEILSSLTKLGLEGEILDRIGPNLGDILQGIVDPIEVLVRDDKINHMQNGMELVQKMKAHLGEYLSHFATKKPVQNVLEVGASTSNMTESLFSAFAGEKNLSYTVTDRSLPILEQMKAPLEGSFKLKALDINQDPVEQGLIPESFDVVIVNNVLYTANSLGEALKNLRKLIAPGGVLVLMGVSDMSPAYNLIFGMNENMYSDKRFEPLEYPSVIEWNKVLQNNNFTTLEPATRTFDFIGQSSYCLVSTALASTQNLMVNIIPCAHDDLFSFANQLSTALAEDNTASTISPTFPDDISPRFIYTVLDDGSARLTEYEKLTKTKNILWICMKTDYTEPRDMAVVQRFARNVRKANDGIKIVTLDVKQKFPDHADILKVVTRIVKVSFQEDRGTRTEFEYEYMNGKVLVPRVKHPDVARKLR
ncbi:lovastatin nonaketide synthase [Fusarium sporotrichioides]|uniref:Lovastatin nonaketide synthase n=1 Tax=Fusarium sporotrichioides TaxID=5514 RepID=A0A395RZ13_FUSSP|nr:lovastatin nonaketide synthase [Fusarium sporotrichioides]